MVNKVKRKKLIPRGEKQEEKTVDKPAKTKTTVEVKKDDNPNNA